MQARILVPRFLDETNINAQNLNAKALLARFRDPHCTWLATHYHPADRTAASNSRVRLVRLWRGRLSRARMFLFYLQQAEAIFYPGGVPDAHLALRIGQWLHGDRLVFGTFEGLAGTEERERELSELAGHRVYCHRVDAATQEKIDSILRGADHVIAISPFLARVGTHLYGGKFSVLPLGIDLSVFHAPSAPRMNARRVVVSAGTLQARKRPEAFLELARRYPEADFVWYGAGELREPLLREARQQGIGNLAFPGPLPPSGLAEVFRAADLFVMPSMSEGVPKVTQEAAACGLPVVLFGHYEAPSVVDGENGFVVWDDAQLADRVGRLLESPELRMRLGKRGARMALALSWEVVASQWEQKLKELLRRTSRSRTDEEGP